MFPEPLFFVLGRPITLYILIRVAGVLLILPLALGLGRDRGLRAEIVVNGWLIGAAAAMVGGLVLPAIAYSFDRNLPDSWSLGAILATILALGFYALRLPETRGWRMIGLDVVLPPIALMLVMGRLSCFAAGCCHGISAENLPWAVTFANPASASIYKDVPVHPTQLYEAAGSLLILLLLLVLFYRPAFKGTLLWIFLLSYGALRFVVEFYRGDERTMLGVLSLNQVVCLIAIVIGGAMLVRRMTLSETLAQKAKISSANLRESSRRKN